MGIEHQIRVTPFCLNGSIGGSVDVLLAGEFDLSTAAELHEHLVRPEVCTARRVQADLRNVSFLDSTTIGLLVAVCKRVRSTGGTFSVICSEGPALQVIEVSGLIDFFEVQSAA